MIRFALPLAALAVSGCMTGKPPRPAPPPAPAPIPGVRCNSNALDSLIGKRQSPEVAAEAMRLSGAASVRWIRPGMMVTMEFRPDRLNLHVGVDGKILSARCG